MGKDVVVIGGSLVGLELAEFLAERGRRVTLLHEKQVLGLPLAMPRRWTAVKDAIAHGVEIHRNVHVDEITPDSVVWTVGEQKHRAKADMVVYADGTTAAAPLADDLRAAGFSVDVVGDAGAVNYIHGAMHTAWDVAIQL
jgi:NADPH-dependent 2,4-dienoyl-CoA reductase/sulfur reductase-like enzyme